MTKKLFCIFARNLILVTVLMLSLYSSTAWAGGKLGLYGIRLTPHGDDAQDYSRPGWGGGVHAVVPLPKQFNFLAGVAGFEYINLLDQTTAFIDNLTGLRIEQQTMQDYVRLYVGPQIGGHGNGFFRPHLGVNLALVIYTINTDVVVPDDYNRENEIRQNLKTKTEGVFGSDITLGLDLNFSNTVVLDGGVKYLKSFSTPQQLGAGSITVHPRYFQIYLGLGVAFEQIEKASKKE